ncbi:peptide-binding protein [Longirhabdus pacifica]|uniref:peptide-binding protein n=1 Tax=Longirhabdus pacifica TaxID=2305227 RepID=UPI001009194B|nr:peptide-binding protein [Longirhabdus pacifica]
MKFKKLFLLLLALTFVFVIAACGDETETEEPMEESGSETSNETEDSKEEESAMEDAKPGEPKAGGTLIVGSSGSPTLFNSLYSTDTASSDIESLIYNGLVGADTTFATEYDLAEDVQLSEDGLTVTVKIKEGVTFHDGEALTADDVVFTYNVPKSPDYVGERGSNFDGIDTITKIDDYTVEFKLNKKDATFVPTTLSYGILPEHILKDVPIAELGENEFNTKSPIGTGPFKFVEWKDGEYVKVTRNDDYFEGAPYLDEVIYKLVPDANTLILQLQAGDIDYHTSVPSSDIETVQGWAADEGVEIISELGLNYTYVGYNQLDERFQDKRVRQAFTHAINREEIVEFILNGRGEVAHVPESPLSWAYNPDVPTFEYDVEKAKELLKEAGWEDTDGDGIIDKDGKKMSFEIKTNQGNKAREEIAVVLQEQFKEIGVEAKPNIVEWSAFIEAVTAPKWEYEVLILGWQLSTFPDQYDIFHSSQQEEGLNFTWYSNPEVDTLLEEAKQILDQDAYKEAYGDIYKGIAEDQPYTFLYYPISNKAIPDNLQNYTFHGTNDFYKIETWWLDE